MITKNVIKGTRVCYSFFQVSKKPQSLSGAQMKVGASLIEETGTVTHIWGNRPIDPTQFTFAVQPDSGGDEIEISSTSIIAVLDE